MITAYDVSSVPTYFPNRENELLPPIDLSPVYNKVPPPVEVKPWTESSTPATNTTTTIIPTTTAFVTVPIPTTTTLSPTTVAALTTTLSPQPQPVPTEVFAGPGPSLLETGFPTPKPKPLPAQNKPEDPRCKLPILPNFDADYADIGYRFFSVREQRLEIPTLPARMRKHYNVSLQFRTGYPSGLLFYAADKRHQDFVAVYLNDGKLIQQVHVGAIAASISSYQELNNEEWHSVEFVRTNRKISLTIDGFEQEPPIAFEEGVTHPMMIEFPLYVGGVPKFLEVNVYNNVQSNLSHYSGCLRDLKFNGASLEKEPNSFKGVAPCSDQVENGFFFSQQAEYIKLFDKFNVGTDFSMSFDMRPRDPNGLLFSVHGNKAYMILELIENSLWFTVKSSPANIVTTNYTLPDNRSYCDGNWRNIHVVKSKFVITISVDYISTNPGVGQEGSTLTKTNRPFFIGGHQAFNRAPGFKTNQTFKGCMRNIQLNNKSVRITPNLVYGEIWQGVCPLN